MKRLTAALLLIISILLLTACAAPAPPEEAEFKLTLCTGPEPASLDPQTAGPEQYVYGLHLFEGLTRYVPAGKEAGDDPRVEAAEIAAGQAESWEVSADGLTWTFRLRDDICWSDGSPVTAADFVFAWQRLTDPAADCPEGDLLAGVVAGAAAIRRGEAAADTLAVSAPDERTFTVTLEQPCPWLPELCARPALSPLPEQAVREWGGQWATAEHLVSNGAFTLELWVEEHFLKLVPNETYYDRESLGPAELFCYFGATETETLALFEDGTCDFIQGFPTEAAASLRAAGFCRTLPRPGLCLLHFSCLNLPDWRVRAALALAVDKEGLCRALAGGQTPAEGLADAFTTLSDGSSVRDSGSDALWAGLAASYPEADLNGAEGRQELARQLLAAAQADGYAQDRPLTLICAAGEVSRTGAACLQNDIRQVLSLDVEIRELDEAAFAQALAAGEFDLARVAWHTPCEDAARYPAMFASGSDRNYGGWSSPEYDLLWAEAAAASGAERDSLLLQAEARLFQAGAFPCWPLYDFGCQYCLRDAGRIVYAPRAGFLFHQARPLDAGTEAAS